MYTSSNYIIGPETEMIFFLMAANNLSLFQSKQKYNFHQASQSVFVPLESGSWIQVSPSVVIW